MPNVFTRVLSRDRRKLHRIDPWSNKPSRRPRTSSPSPSSGRPCGTSCDVARKSPASRGSRPQRYTLLMMIKGSPDGGEQSTVTELSERLQLAQSTVTELVRRAESAGLIEREQSQRDARVAHLRLTPEGERRLMLSFTELETGARTAARGVRQPRRRRHRALLAPREQVPADARDEDARDRWPRASRRARGALPRSRRGRGTRRARAAPPRDARGGATSPFAAKSSRSSVSREQARVRGIAGRLELVERGGRDRVVRARAGRRRARVRPDCVTRASSATTQLGPRDVMERPVRAGEVEAAVRERERRPVSLDELGVRARARSARARGARARGRARRPRARAARGRSASAPAPVPTSRARSSPLGWTKSRTCSGKARCAARPAGAATRSAVRAKRSVDGRCARARAEPALIPQAIS